MLNLTKDAVRTGTVFVYYVVVPVMGQEVSVSVDNTHKVSGSTSNGRGSVNICGQHPHGTWYYK
jgi:hypothetical protein